MPRKSHTQNHHRPGRRYEQDGFGVLSGYLEPADLEDLRQFVETAVAAAGGEYVVFTGEEAVAGTLLDKLSASPAFVNLRHQVYEQGSGRAAPNQSLYQVLRCLKGKSGLKHALDFHYDSYLVIALLPVIIPSKGRAGHLVMAPNWRPVRSSYLFNTEDNQYQLDGQQVHVRLKFSHQDKDYHFSAIVTNDENWDVIVVVRSNVAPEKIITSGINSLDLDRA
jgi:hypothetical protein